MIALTDQVGMTGPQYAVDIERGKIREFARAMAAPIDEFVTGGQPIIPATFLVCAPYTWGYTLERPRGTVFAEVAHDLSVSLHAEEAFYFPGSPPCAGDRLIAQSTLEKSWQKQGGSGGLLTFLTVLTRYHNQQNDLVAEQRSTSVTTQATPNEAGGWQIELPDYAPDYPQLERVSPFAGIARQRFIDLRLNQGPGVVQAAPLLKQEIVRFQGVVGEDDPLHHDTVWAQQQGYPDVFALGTHQASLMAAYAAYWLPPEAVRGFRVRFHDLAWPGDRLSYAGKVIELDENKTTARVHLSCTRADGSRVSEAWMDFNYGF